MTYQAVIELVTGFLSNPIVVSIGLVFAMLMIAVEEQGGFK